MTVKSKEMQSPGLNRATCTRKYAREFSFARCQDEAGSEMLHRGSISPAAEVCGKLPAFEIEGKKIVDGVVDVKNR